MGATICLILRAAAASVSCESFSPIRVSSTAAVTTLGPTLPQAGRATSITPDGDSRSSAAMLAMAHAMDLRCPTFPK